LPRDLDVFFFGTAMIHSTQNIELRAMFCPILGLSQAINQHL